MNDMLRKMLIAGMLSDMTDEDKRNLAVLTGKDGHKEIMDDLAIQRKLINNIARRVERQNWYVDFGSDLLANFTTDFIIYIGSKLFKR